MDRRERRHKETRDEILREARKLVTANGAGALSMRDLAKAADFTAPALYRYFPEGKDQILLALAIQALESLGSHLRRVPLDLPPEERLIELGLIYLEFAREHGDELSLLLESVAAVEPMDVDDPGRGLLGETNLFSLIDQAFRDAVEAGILRAASPDDIDLMWHGAWSLLHGIAVIEKLHPHHDRLYRARARDVLQAYINGLKTDWTRHGD